MENEEVDNLFDGCFLPEEPIAEKATNGFVPFERERLDAMSKPELLAYIDEVHKIYAALESDVRFMSWEFQDYQDNLAFFSRAAKFAHKLNSSDMDTFTQVAVQDIPAYFKCGAAALFLYDMSAMRFEMRCFSTPVVDAKRFEERRDFLIRLFTIRRFPFIAEYFPEKGYIEIDGHEKLELAVSPEWTEIFGSKILVMPLLVNQGELLDPLTLGGVIIGKPQAYFELRDAEVAIFFAEILSSSLYNAQLLQKLNDLIVVDPLTQIFNRRHLISHLRSAMIQANRQKHPLSIAMLDIDFFKRFNDDYGHICGDVILQEVASVLKGGIRTGVDVAARYGGEEFMLVLPFTPLDHAIEVANRIRKTVKESSVPCDGELLSVTCSIGVAEFRMGETLEKFIERADASLYQAKKEGRDRVCAATGTVHRDGDSTVVLKPGIDYWPR